jgi:hypothetical protein
MFNIQNALSLTNSGRHDLLSQSERSQLSHFINCRRNYRRGIMPDQIHQIAIVSAVRRETEESILRDSLSSEVVAEAVLADAVVITVPGQVKSVSASVRVLNLKTFVVEAELGSEGFSAVRGSPAGALTADRARDLAEEAEQYARNNPRVRVRVIRSEGKNRRAVLCYRFDESGEPLSY